jgi:hypothetical protein
VALSENALNDCAVFGNFGSKGGRERSECWLILIFNVHFTYIFVVFLKICSKVSIIRI